VTTLLFQQTELGKDLSDIRNLVYSRDPSATKDAQAAERLVKLVERRIPYAVLLQSVFMWHGYGFEQDPDKAYALATEAAELGEIDALVVLASMHFAGYGCEQSFEKSVALIARFDNEAPVLPFCLRIGEVGLGYFEFTSEFIINVNGQNVVSPIDVLEELNYWILDCKRKCIAWQADILERDPKAFGGISTRRLPYKGSICGSCFSLKGKNHISHLGFRASWLNEVIWFETDRLTGWPTGIGFDGLTEFDALPAAELVEIGRIYLANRHKGLDFELRLTRSSVHRDSKFFCGDNEVMLAYED